MLIDAKYYDGVHSNSHNVKLEIWSDRLYILKPEGNISWYFDKIILREKLSRHSDGRLEYEEVPDAQLNISNPDDFNKILEKLPRKRTKTNYTPFINYTVVIALMLFLVIYLVPATSPFIAAQMPREWEEKLGDWTVKSITHNEPVCKNANGLAALNKLNQALAKHVESDFNFRTKVIFSDENNAFAAPGGNIIIFGKLVESAKNESELAGVLAHEMGHVAKRHGVEVATRALITSFVIDIFTGGGGTAIYALNELNNLSYSRSKEAEADAFALELLSKANINPQGLYNFFARMAEKEKNSYFPELLSTHPSGKARMDILKSKLNPNRQYNNILTPEEFAELQRICY